ncbi:hypothetical protein [Shewanella surugensis]|uniref:Uncharacterized protein n=1 Tax=Shewanella surugensis TaxID=212020 RepID=A0ABT0LA47_9GAMM|nr:hypothetical protein [Shewanella surugensis]MCL1124567.1 hypothetical protein [Shewanella surugensis]
MAFTALKNFAIGIGASVSYAVSVAFLYPIWDLYLGTLFSLVRFTWVYNTQY